MTSLAQYIGLLIKLKVKRLYLISTAISVSDTVLTNKITDLEKSQCCTRFFRRHALPTLNSQAIYLKFFARLTP